MALIDRLLDDHTDAQTAAQLNTAGCRSGMNKPFTARLVLGVRRRYNLPSHADRLRARGMLTINEVAGQLGVHPSTVKAWHGAGLLTSDKADDKNQRLFEPPTPGDHRLVKRLGWPLTKREPASPSPGGAL